MDDKSIRHKNLDLSKFTHYPFEITEDITILPSGVPIQQVLGWAILDNRRCLLADFD